MKVEKVEHVEQVLRGILDDYPEILYGSKSVV